MDEYATLETASALAPVRAAEYEKDGLRMLDAVSTYPPIDSRELAEMYAAEVVDVKTVLRNIKAEQVKITAPLNAALEAAYEFFRKARTPYEQTELILKGHIGMWEMAQRRAQEQAQREAEAQAEAEREALRAQAAELDVSGDVQQALELRQVAAMTPTAVVASAPKLPGISVGGTWEAALVSKRSLIEFVATHPEYDELLEYKPSVGNALARSLKDKLRIAGLEARFKPRVAARAK